MWRSLALISGALLLGLLLAGCKQKEGDRCNLDSDCETGLFCCVKPADRARGGLCTLPTKCDLTQTDSGPREAGTREAGSKDVGTKDTKAGVDTKAGPDTKAAPDTKTAAPDTKGATDLPPPDTKK